MHSLFLPLSLLRPLQVRSSAVRQAFSWDTPVDPVVVARQVHEVKGGSVSQL